jgi:hypothetical protein
MQELRSLENGVSLVFNNKKVKLFCFLYSWICDMEERRDILDLSLQPHWICTHCFGRPLPKSTPFENPNLDLLITGNAPRTFENIALLKNTIRKGADGKYDDDFDFESRTGFAVNMNCPVTADNFILDGASSYFLFDRLHLLDGVRERLWNMLRKVYGPSLEEVSESLGNKSCGVTTDFRFHKMEEALHDFQYVALTLLFGCF